MHSVDDRHSRQEAASTAIKNQTHNKQISSATDTTNMKKASQHIGESTITTEQH